MSDVRVLRELIEDLLDTPAPASDAELRAELIELQRAGAQFEALLAKRLAAADLRRAYASDGSKTVGAWLARQSNASPKVTASRARLARRLRTMPVVATALAAGEISEEHARVLARQAASPRKVIADTFSEAEELLVGFAKDLCFEDFCHAVKKWADVVDPDGSEDDAARQRDRRRVHLSQTLGGEWILDGRLDAVEGTALHTALSRIEHELWMADWADAKDGGFEPAEGQVCRTSPQRRADALVEMANRAMAMPKGARKPRPLVTAVVDLDTLKGKVCELFNKTPITPGQVARILEAADVERVVFQGPNRVIELGATTRLFTGGLRRALEIRDRHCQHPGCRRPAEFCQGDHIRPHGQGGITEQSNGRMLCEFHNLWRVNGERQDHKGVQRGAGRASLGRNRGTG